MSRADNSTEHNGLILGWEEWLSLPGLGLAAIKAKIDTGARTSALHAFDIEPYESAGSPMVRFSVHPVRARDDIIVHCSAPVVDRREVISSNGERDLRFVIETPVRIAGRQWSIEITLTDRSSMSYRMLLGRSAIRGEIVVDPTASFHQPRLSYRSYRDTSRGRRPVRPLVIALLGPHTSRPTDNAIVQEAVRRGHRITHIDPDATDLLFADGAARLLVDGKECTPPDAIIPHIGGSHRIAHIAVARQFELMGAVSPNPADALMRCINRVTIAQHLLRLGIPIAPLATISEGHSETADIKASTNGVRVLIVAGNALTALSVALDGTQDVPTHSRTLLSAQFNLAQQTARILGLGLADVLVVEKERGLAVAQVTPYPKLARFKRLTGTRAVPALLALLEERSRSNRNPATPHIAHG